MAPISLAAGLALLIASSSATEQVWSSVAYILHGERTPLRGTTFPALTPLGAQQMYAQGSMFRARYLDNSSSSGGTFAVTDHVPIQDIESNALDNSQLTLLATTDEWVAASALAFTQGLYPPRNQSFAEDNGGMESAVLANHTMIDFPLGGYQYPKVQTLSILDPTATWIEGNVACSQYQQSILNFRNDTNVIQVYDRTLNFYQTLWNTVFQGVFPSSMANFYYAHELYDYALYEYNHNPQIHNVLNTSELIMLETLATIQQRDLNANLTASGKYYGDMIRAISGRMLAAKIVAQLKESIASGGVSDKLNVIFGSHEPFISFFALANLFDSTAAADFEALPTSGAAMVFELFSDEQNSSSVYPTNENLWVRFLYRPTTDSSTPFTEYPIFGNGDSQKSMRFVDFVTAMQGVAVTSVADWCDMCDSVTLFCEALEDNSSGSSFSSGPGANGRAVTPAVAGVIGAVVSLSVIGLAALAAIVLGRVRFYRADKGRNSSLGGFKGTEKMASDTDLAVSNRGARHERVGSWELRGGKDAATAVTPIGAVVQKETTTSSFKNIEDDAISVIADTPVKPRESV